MPFIFSLLPNHAYGMHDVESFLCVGRKKPKKGQRRLGRAFLSRALNLLKNINVAHGLSTFYNNLKSSKAQTLFVLDIWPCFHAVGGIYNGMREEFVSL